MRGTGGTGGWSRQWQWEGNKKAEREEKGLGRRVKKVEGLKEQTNEDGRRADGRQGSRIEGRQGRRGRPLSLMKAAVALWKKGILWVEKRDPH